MVGWAPRSCSAEHCSALPGSAPSACWPCSISSLPQEKGEHRLKEPCSFSGRTHRPSASHEPTTRHFPAVEHRAAPFRGPGRPESRGFAEAHPAECLRRRAPAPTPRPPPFNSSFAQRLWLPRRRQPVLQVQKRLRSCFAGPELDGMGEKLEGRRMGGRWWEGAGGAIVTKGSSRERKGRGSERRPAGETRTSEVITATGGWRTRRAPGDYGHCNGAKFAMKAGARNATRPGEREGAGSWVGCEGSLRLIWRGRNPIGGAGAGERGNRLAPAKPPESTSHYQHIQLSDQLESGSSDTTLVTPIHRRSQSLAPVEADSR